ncbi:hypothetical protein Lser_V15G21793 [Lactuca serriola]
MAKKSKSPSPSSSKNDEEDEEEEIHHVSPRGNTPPRSPTPTEPPHEKLPIPPPSLKQRIPISVAPVPPPTTSQTTTSIPPPPPVTTIPISITPIPSLIISQSTSTTIPQPKVGVNISDTGATTETEPPVTSKPISPSPSTDSDPTLGGATDEFDSIYYSPYTLPTNDDDEAPSIDEKLDNLLYANKSYNDTSAAKVNAFVDSLSKCIQAEQTKFEVVHSSIQAENTSLISSVNFQFESLNVALAKESSLKEDLARQASTIEVQKVQLAQAEKEISLLKTERVFFHSCVGDIKDMLTSLLGAHDPILTLTIRNHLTSKLLLALALLHETKGVSEKFISPKQGGEGAQPKVTVKTEIESPQPKVDVTTKPKGNEASGSGSQAKGIDNDSTEEEEEETITEALKRKKNRELDEALRIAREAEERERRNKEEEKP